MRVLLLGCGNIGSVIALDLINITSVNELVLADKYTSRLRNFIKRNPKSNVSGLKLDVNDYEVLVDTIRKFDLVIDALPGKYGFKCIKAAIEAGVDIVDVSYMPENVLTINGDAVKAGITIIPDIGVAPGLSNILIGHAVKMLDVVDSIHIYVGGLPMKPIPPLGYVITWSVADLIDEYIRRPKIIHDGRVVEVEALSGLEELEFPGLGKLEAFYTDGLRTLLYTIKGVRSMWEKTLRYPSHASKIMFLKELGFFDDSPIDNVIPKDFTAKLLEKNLRRNDVKDLLAMKIKVCGYKEENKICHIYQLLEYYDPDRDITAMAKTTAYPASIITQLMIDGKINEKGVIPPEKLGMNDMVYREFMMGLNKKNIRISEWVHVL